MSKVLWIGDGGSATGFSRVSHSIGDRLVDLGHEVHLLATNYKGDPYPTKVELYVPTIHDGGDVYGMSRFIELAAKIRPDVIVMLNDPQVLYAWLFNNKHDTERLLVQGFPIITYTPIDGTDYPAMYSVLGQSTNQIAMSKHGQSILPGSEMVYHGVDGDLFWPVSSEHPITRSNGQILRNKRDCKRSFGLPAEAFVIGRVDANSGRKDYASSWKSVLPVMKKHTDVITYFHCRAKNEQSGVNLPALFSRDMDTMERFRLPRSFDSSRFTQQDLNAIYNMFDVFISNSRGEGFGLTLAEAAACGIPVIAQNVSAIPEVVGPGGELIEPDRPITVPFGQDQWLSDTGAFSEAIERAYGSRRWRRETGAAGREHVLRSFRWDDAATSFHEYIEVLAHGNQDAAASPDTAPSGAGADRASRAERKPARQRRRATA